MIISRIFTLKKYFIFKLPKILLNCLLNFVVFYAQYLFFLFLSHLICHKTNPYSWEILNFSIIAFNICRKKCILNILKTFSFVAIVLMTKIARKDLTKLKIFDNISCSMAFREHRNSNNRMGLKRHNYRKKQKVKRNVIPMNSKIWHQKIIFQSNLSTIYNNHSSLNQKKKYFLAKKIIIKQNF